MVVVVLAALVLPAVRNRDSFPLSTYPMYAGTRDAVETLPTVIGLDRSGEARRLSSTTVARTDDPLIATSLLRTAIRTDRADALCAEIAARAPEGTVTVEVVEERLDLVARVQGDDAVLDRLVHARCSVPA